MNGEFTGRRMAMILVAFFGVIILVNLTMARLAMSTFGGVVVENSYVASQEFNRWLDAAEADRALGWEAALVRRPDGRVGLELSGAPAGIEVSAHARHPLGRLPDESLTFAAEGGGRFVSREVLPPGRWTVRIEARNGERAWRHEGPL
jgi:nitrogen fixation protein FixH